MYHLYFSFVASAVLGNLSHGIAFKSTTTSILKCSFLKKAYISKRDNISQSYGMKLLALIIFILTKKIKTDALPASERCTRPFIKISNINLQRDKISNDPQGSHNVATWMSQQKNKYIDTLRILHSISMPPSTLVEDSPNDRHQPSASSIHKLPLILCKEKRPHVDPMSSSVHNLQKLIMISPVKNNIITTIPHCPNECTYSNLNSFFNFFINTIKSSPKQLFYISRWRNIENKIHNLPNYFSKRTLNENLFILKNNPCLINYLLRYIIMQQN
jgi:hypothetical protein